MAKVKTNGHISDTMFIFCFMAIRPFLFPKILQVKYFTHDLVNITERCDMFTGHW